MTCNIENVGAVSSEEKSKAELVLPEGVPPLASLYMYITDACNLRCRHCWISPRYDPACEKGHFLKSYYVEKAIDESLPLGLAAVKLSGGEPFLHPNIKELLSIINRNRLRIIIETNGTLIDSNLAQVLGKLKSPIYISVSVDGLDTATHDWFRGVEGSFEKSINGIKNLVENKIYPQLICTLHRYNVKQMEEMVNMAGFLGCSSIKFNHIQPLGRGESKSDLALPFDDILKCYEMIEERLSQNNQIPICFDVPYAFKSIRQLSHDTLSRCHIKNILGVLADGRLSICGIGEAVPELIFGHVGQDSLEDIWLNHLTLQELRELIPRSLEGICAQCIHRNFCMGHCVAQAFYRTKKLNSPYWFCEYARDKDKFPINRLTNYILKDEEVFNGFKKTETYV